MTTDVNGTVVGIQGNPVEAETLGSTEDGYILTWKNADDQWEAKPYPGLQSQTFTSSGTWTCPLNVFNVWLTGWGAGAGGSAGIGNTSSAQGGGGGGGSVRVNSVVPVVPGTNYSVVIGNGGLGGIGTTNTFVDGGSGGNTTFGSLFTAPGGGSTDGGNSGGSLGTLTYVLGGPNIGGNYPASAADNNGNVSPRGIGCGGYGVSTGAPGSAGYGYANEGFVGGTPGTTASGGGSGSGGAGPGGNGGNGGNGGTTPTNGSNAANNSGAGGGGGGGSTSNVNGGSGGNGGSGLFTVSWIG